MSEDIQSALYRIDTHEQVCTERYGNIWKALTDLKSDVAALQLSVTASNTQHHERFNTISSRMWGVLVWACASSVVGLAAVIFYLLTKK